MPQFETTRKVRHSAAQMFALVADVEKYPEFVPMCERLSVRLRRETPEGEILVADMTVGYGPVRETFTSKVQLDRQALAIVVEYLDGPFKFLDNRWTFQPTGEQSCDVGFWIHYEFKSKVLGALMGSMFDRAFRKFSEAFETRADKVYGVPA
ncbi:type II toxin-antitoxin system RatA family toxin [Oryzibacter oryziterrae]|uniref:type II toxin-antitoxin system RatA family toxin n=1 Tax=Oryzibacter oryziterrae TaxID=2766474 RepID=UPI001F31E126|nr:type II toxin-antitoxin system RatA family toxin [Oryzibacter oryziterrae]